MNTQPIQLAEPIPGYRLVERLGRGGFGEVWKVVAPGGVYKAIKFVHGDMDGGGDAGQAAEQELKALNRVKTIRHPYLLSIDRFDIVEGRLMIVMEMADRSLWERFEECQSQGLQGIPRGELLRYLEEASEALDLMNVHHQIQHLDVKPQNLLLVHNHVKVADFGLAKDFEGIRGIVTGGVTPVYAAPETSEGWISRGCDQYSLAIVYQELLTGTRPFTGINTAHLLIQHLTAAPNVSQVPIQERSILTRALSKKPEERFASCTEFVQALRRSGCGDSAEFVSISTPTASAPISRPAEPVPSPFPITPVVERAPAKATDPVLTTPRGVLECQTRRLAPEQLRGNGPNAERRAAKGTVAAESERGVLHPVYIVAAGTLGLRVMQFLRTRLFKRFNRGTFPHWRWLFIDTDQAAIDGATTASKRLCLAVNEVYHARLERPMHYMKREGLPPPSVWMGNDTLYRIPRLPATGGLRCLGRLALLDHVQAISQRIQSDLEAICAHGTIEEAAKQTGLEVRSRTPRVYLAASLTGGTGSGMLVDLAYLIRKEMQHAGISDPRLTGFVMTPPAEARQSAQMGIANTFAALTELNHWSQCENSFDARFDTRQPTRFDSARPLDRCVLVSLPNDPAVEFPPAAAKAADLLIQETLTPTGRTLDQARNRFRTSHPNNGLSLQSCGSYRIVWPQQRLLDAITYRHAAKTIKEWIADGGSSDQNIEVWLDSKWRESGFGPMELTAKLHDAAAIGLKASPKTLIEVEMKLLAHLGNRTDAAAFASAIERIAALVGKSGTEEEVMPGKIGVSFRAATETVSKEAELTLSRLVADFVQQPSCQISTAEAVIRTVAQWVRSQVDLCDVQCERLKSDMDESFSKILATLAAMSQAGSKRINGTGDLNVRLPEWAGKRLEYLTSRCLVAIYRQMLSSEPEYLRAAASCRKQLQQWATRLGREVDVIVDSSIANEKLILPTGCKTLLDAADMLICQIGDDRRLNFIEAMQPHFGAEPQTLAEIDRAIGEAGLSLVKSLVSQSKTIVEPGIRKNTAAAELLRDRPDSSTLESELLEAFENCKPNGFGPTPSGEAHSFVLGTSTDVQGQALRAEFRKLLPDQTIVDAESSDEITLYRECHELALTDLPQVGPSAVQAVFDLRAKQRLNPYSRMDVRWTAFLPE